MIVSFGDEETRKVFRTGKGRRYGAIARMAARRLGELDQAKDVLELRQPPGNRLEKLKGDRVGRWSIRVNGQFQICFEWRGSDAEEVEIVDFH